MNIPFNLDSSGIPAPLNLSSDLFLLFNQYYSVDK
jgi:hypothetical protein